MPPSVRRATAKDIPAIVDLLILDGKQRNSLDPMLWRLADDARSRPENAVRSALDSPRSPLPQLWLVAEADGRIVGVTHAIVVPVPPIYDIAAGSPGLILDDCFTSVNAPAETAELLIRATETAIRELGGSGLIASCPVAGTWRPLYERHAYEPVTLYMVKHEFHMKPLGPGVTAAREENVPGIVRLSAEHRKKLEALNARFWHIHPEADSRFAAWMRYSLTLADRSMFVAHAHGDMHGYVIAQPLSPLHIPAIHEISGIGLIDDFYDLGFGNVTTVTDGGTVASNLLSAAESALARQDFTTALVVCPAAWTSKIAFLEDHGYRAAKLWMLKR